MWDIYTFTFNSNTFIIRYLLRRVSARAILSPITPISSRSRPLSTLRSSILSANRPTSVIQFQRRFASGEVTQAEPEADGATEAQHGKNSIASSTQESELDDTNDLSNGFESTGLDDVPQELELDETDHVPTSADHENHSSVAAAVSSAAETVSTKASEATEAAAQFVTGSSDDRQPRSTQSRQDPSGSLYIGNLFFDVTEEALRKEMDRFGPIESVKIVVDGRGLSKGYVLHG